MTPHRTGQLTPPVAERDHVRGPAKAPLTLVEYGDYECPYCGKAYSVVEEVLQQLGSRVRFAFRHCPLATVHPHAQNAAEAAEAAGAQGKFWEMHTTLFENQEDLEEEALLQYAAELGLDPVRFANELARHTHAARVREDFLSGVHSGVNGTPTFFINGVRHEGGLDVESLLEAMAMAKGAEAQ
jgi:protein-disulfide isomerase